MIIWLLAGGIVCLYRPVGTVEERTIKLQSNPQFKLCTEDSEGPADNPRQHLEVIKTIIVQKGDWHRA